MANDLKRVGLVFTQEGAVDFRKTLQEVNIELNKNSNQFKLVQQQWDESTTKIQKLTSEQEYLSNAYEIQTDRVSALKMQLADLENAENKNTTAIKRKQNELTNAQLKLQNYKDRLDKTSTSLENAKNGIETAAEKTKRLTNEIKENESSFKLVQSQYTELTSKTQKLKNEQEYLTNVYKLQSEKVEVLQSQLDELESVEDKNTNAISKKRNELIKAQTELNNYSNKLQKVTTELENFGAKMIAVGSKIENVGRKIEKAGTKVSAFSIATATALAASAKTTIDFEDAFTGVEKTVDGTTEQMAELKQGIRDMTKSIPATTTEISAVAEAAGQLGIKTEDIISFTKVMIDLGNSTNLSAEEAASALAKFANITNMSAKDYDRLGSVIVALGNNFATTEADIVQMATKLAATGDLAGLSQAQILALATAMSSVGIEAEAGGSAMSKLLKQIQVAVETGSSDLKDFAKVAGMSSKEFKSAFEKDAVKALAAFISGLNDTKRNGKSAIAILQDMNLTEVRLSNTILSLSNSSEVMNNAIELGNKAWEDNTALTNEANKRYATLKSKIEVAWNKIKDLAITLGDKLTPILSRATDKIDILTKRVAGLTDKDVEMIASIAEAVVVVGPLINIFGKLTSGIGGTITTIGKLKEALDVASGVASTTSASVNTIAKVIQVAVSPTGIACGLIGVAIAGIAIAAQNTSKETKEAFSNIGDGASDFIKGIDEAKSHLSDFNTTLFVSVEEQEELQNQMKDIQKGITNICKTASDERRGYTQEEITQLDEYFTKLRELNQREIEIQQSIAGAITQQAVTNSEAFNGSLEEYKQVSQEWLKTAQEQKDKTIELINNQTIEEIALLNQRYGNEANMQNEAYAIEYNKILENKQSKIDAANDEVAKISKVYSDGYLERSNQQNGWLDTLEKYNSQIEEENKRNADTLENIQNNILLTQYNKNQSKAQENYRYQNETKKIWNKMYKDLSESQEEQLGVWLAQVQQTELYGGKIDAKTKEIVDSIIESYDSMPSKTREAMKNAMIPMEEEMEKKEPALLAKAKGIADGIISKLKKAFDEHSPSKKTRKIMKFAMQPMEEEMEDGEKNLFKKADEIGNGITDRLSEIDGNVEINGKNRGKTDQFYQNAIINTDVIDYNKMANAFAKALTNCKFSIDEDGFARIVKEEIYKVV